ncbi:MAG: hypothetical protein FGM22_07255 [Burkholderiaceae bacterium]|nr:hypothetical protein [Burkholderiaceae bacterium]
MSYVIDHLRTDIPVCPECGEEADDNLFDDGRQFVVSTVCSNCNTQFSVRTYHTVEYSTFPIMNQQPSESAPNTLINDGGTVATIVTRSEAAIVDAGGKPVHVTTFMHEGGLTVRQYLAGQAMQGLLADHQLFGDTDSFVRRSYEIADAMIAYKG